MSLKLYTARNQHIAIVDDEEHGADGVYRCDITLILLHAANDEEAFQRALHYGRCHEHEYLNSDGQRVRWVFRKVEQVYRIVEPFEGLEIGSVLAYENVGVKTTYRRRLRSWHSSPPFRRLLSRTGRRKRHLNSQRPITKRCTPSLDKPL